MTIGERVKEKRMEMGLTQKQLAQRAGTSESVLCRIEKSGRHPDPDLVVRLAGALGVTVSYLLGEQHPDTQASEHSAMAERIVRLDQRVTQLQEDVSMRERMIEYLKSLIDRLLPGTRGGGDS